MDSEDADRECTSTDVENEEPGEKTADVLEKLDDQSLKPKPGVRSSSAPEDWEKNETSDLNATRLYLNEIGFSPLLSADEEKHFARGVKQGDAECRKRMIESNLRLVVKIAQRYRNRGMALLDLIEEGNLGLIKAVEKFDPERGFRFSTYATWWIRQTIERGIMNQTRTIRLPIHVVKEINSCLRANYKLSQTLDREPTSQDVATMLDRKKEDVDKMLGFNERVVSMDAPADRNSERTVIDTVADDQNKDPSHLLQDEEAHKHLEAWLNELNDKQRTVIEYRFGLHGHEASTLEEVGKEIGVTRERVRQIQIEALKRLRLHLERAGLSIETLSADEKSTYNQ